MTKHVNITETPWLIQAIRGAFRPGEYTIVREGKWEFAAIIPMADFRLLERLTSKEEDRIDLAAAKTSRAEGGHRVPLDEFVAEMREEG